MDLEAHGNCQCLAGGPELPVTALSELWFLYLQQEEMDLGLGLTELEIKIVPPPPPAPRSPA